MADVEEDRQNLLSFDAREDSDETLLDADELLHRHDKGGGAQSKEVPLELDITDPLPKENNTAPAQITTTEHAENSLKDFHKSTLNEVPLEGDILVPGAPQDEEDEEFNTLDEPVKDTIMRDLKAIGVKFFHVLYPKESKTLLREWDWWGPLMLCIFLALMLQGSTERANDLNDGGPQFAEVFVIYWVGAIIVTLNIKLLGGAISFFQAVCILGYCVLPLTIALVVCRLILIAEQSTALFAIRCTVTALSLGWSTFASTAFLAESQPPRRKPLAVYPIFLFYFIISWLIISHTH